MKKLLAYSLIPLIAAFAVEGASAKSGKIHLSYLHQHIHSKIQKKFCPPRPAGIAISRACARSNDRARFCRGFGDFCDTDTDDHFAFHPGHGHGHLKH